MGVHGLAAPGDIVKVILLGDPHGTPEFRDLQAPQSDVRVEAASRPPGQGRDLGEGEKAGDPFGLVTRSPRLARADGRVERRRHDAGGASSSLARLEEFGGCDPSRP